MDNTCHVAGCRNRKQHVTERHCCGRCFMNGHGQIECTNDFLKYNLKQFNGNVINVPCLFNKCIDPHTHTTEGHSCLYCDERIKEGDIDIIHLNYCPLNNTSEEHTRIYNDSTIPECFVESVKNIEVSNGKYKYVFSGMGSVVYIRCDYKGNKHYLTIFQGDWGQYGKNTSLVPAIKSIIYGFTSTQ